MSRILVDGLAYSYQRQGGIRRYFTELLSRIGHYLDNVQVTLHLPANGEPPFPDGEWIRLVKDWNLKPRSLLGPWGKRLGRVRAGTPHPHIFHSTYYTFPYSSNVKTVITAYDFIHERFPMFLGAPNLTVRKRQAIEQSDAVIAISRATKRDILRFADIAEEDVIVIYPGVSPVFLAENPAEKEQENFLRKYRIRQPYWLFVGERSTYKNFNTLLRTFAKIATEVDGDLVAVGGKEKFDPWQVDFLIHNRLDHRVHLISPADDQTLRLAYLGAAGFVTPSLMEGFGMCTLEAMACGTPTILSDIAVFHEVADDAALYFDPYDGDALAQTMMKVLERPLREELTRKGRGRVSQFSWDASARKLAEVYSSLL